MLNMCNMQQP